jgi:hypothetical protein
LGLRSRPLRSTSTESMLFDVTESCIGSVIFSICFVCHRKTSIGDLMIA